MDKIIYRLRKIVFLIATILCIGYTYANQIIPEEELITEIRLYPYYVDTYYEEISDNSGITSLNGISNVKVNMLSEGFEVYNEDTNSNFIDISFTNPAGEAYRYYYDMKTGVVTFFYSDYEKSSMGMSYIIEKKGKE